MGKQSEVFIITQETVKFRLLYKKGGETPPFVVQSITGQLFPTSRHLNQEVKKGTLQKIIKQSGIKI